MNTNTMELNLNEMETVNGGADLLRYLFITAGGMIAGGAAGSLGGPVGTIIGGTVGGVAGAAYAIATDD